MRSRPDLHQVLNCVAMVKDAAIPLAVASLLRTEGSAPVEAGAKALIGPPGLLAGTIGGGAVEGEALRRAGAMINDRPFAPCAEIFDFKLQGPGGMDPNPICGGIMRVLV